MIPSPYALRGVKSFKGSDDLGFNATLLCAGKKVAEVMDAGDGDLFLGFDWVSADAEAAFTAHCAQWPAKVVMGQSEPLTPDDVILRMVDHHTFIADMKRQLKKSLVLVKDGAPAHPGIEEGLFDHPRPDRCLCQGQPHGHRAQRLADRGRPGAGMGGGHRSIERSHGGSRCAGPGHSAGQPGRRPAPLSAAFAKLSKSR